MLTGRFRDRIRAAVDPPGALSVQLRTAEFTDSVARGWPHVAILDPTLPDNVGAVVACLRRARLGTVLYVRLTPAYASCLVAFVRQANADVVTYGYSDDPVTLARVLTLTAHRERGSILLQFLTEALTALPSHIRRGIEEFNKSVQHIDSARQLACYCGVSNYTLNVHLRNAGMASAKRVVAALALVRAYDVLADAGLPVCHAAAQLRIASARALEHRCVTVSGARIRQLREGMSLEDFAKRVAERVTRSQTVERPAEN